MNTIESPVTDPVTSLPMFEYSKIKKQVDTILDEWKAEEEDKVKKRRNLRRDTRDVNTMRSNKEIGPSDNFIPQHLIDQHIQEEKPTQIAYIEQPDRLLIMQDLTDTTQPTEDIESQFTSHMRYPGWSIPWHCAFDSIDLHGGCALEVKYDDSKPLKCSIDYIPRDEFIFPIEATSIQECEYIARAYKYMPFELEGFVKKYGFDEEQVRLIVKDSESCRHQKKTIYRVFCKKDDVVYVFWYYNSCHSFLKAPAPLDLGIYDKEEMVAFYAQIDEYKNNPETISIDPMTGQQVVMPAQTPTPPKPILIGEYPIFWLPYEVIEDQKLLSSKGRAFRDKSDQEAITELWTSIINAANKASKVYGSYANSPHTQEGIDETTPMQPDTITGRQVNFWNYPFPDAGLVGVVTQYSSAVAAKGARVDFGVVNRKDSGNKTATEIQAAQQQASQLSSVGISGQSLTILKVWELAWNIGLSQILIREVTTFTLQSNPGDNRLLHEYRLAPAGDVDILKRDAKRQVIRETFQYLANTPLANKFLEYLVKQYFPEYANAWIPILNSQDPVNLIQVATQLLSAVPRTSLTPMQSNQLDQVLQMFNEYIRVRSGGGVSGNSQPVAESSPNTVPNNLPKEQGGAASGTSNS